MCVLNVLCVVWGVVRTGGDDSRLTTAKPQRYYRDATQSMPLPLPRKYDKNDKTKTTKGRETRETLLHATYEEYIPYL